MATLKKSKRKNKTENNKCYQECREVGMFGAFLVECKATVVHGMQFLKTYSGTLVF